MLELIGFVVLAGFVIGTLMYLRTETYKEQNKQVDTANTDPILPVTRSKVAKVRARTETGKFKADDPSTPDVNEAYKSGRKPRKSRVKKET